MSLIDCAQMYIKSTMKTDDKEEQKASVIKQRIRMHFRAFGNLDFGPTKDDINYLYKKALEKNPTGEKFVLEIDYGFNITVDKWGKIIDAPQPKSQSQLISRNPQGDNRFVEAKLDNNGKFDEQQKLIKARWTP